MPVSSPDETISLSTLVLGAGLSGLMAGRRLHAAGVKVLVVDKGRGVGGRCATRRMGTQWLDHGAQFFTVRGPLLRGLVETWREDGLVREWCRGFPDGPGTRQDDGHARYCAVAGMSTLAKSLAEGVPVRTNTQVTSIEKTGGRWRAGTGCGMTIEADRLIMTAPLPQAVALLPPAVREELLREVPALQAVTYEACFAVLLVLDGPSGLPEPGGLHVPGPVIAWMADNTRKGRLTGASAVTIHTTPEFAEAHLEDPVDAIAEQVLAAAGPWLGSGVLDWQVHRWRYSKPRACVGLPCVTLGDTANLILCGDYLEPPARIEGAINTGAAAADAALVARALDAERDERGREASG